MLVYENIGDENLMYYRYDRNGTVIAINRIRLSDGATGLLYPVTNSRGDVVELRNGSGVLNAKYTYDSWGKLISITDANGNPVSEDSLAMFNSIRYRGYVYDRETGLYYLQSRYYDPETGRFLNADDDYILDISLLESELMSAVVSSDSQVDFSVSSTYSMRVSGNIADRLTEVEKKSLSYLFVAIALLYDYDKDLANKIFSASASFQQLSWIAYYTDPVTKKTIDEVTLYIKAPHYYNIFTDKTFERAYEIVFYFGERETWSMYLNYSKKSREFKYKDLFEVLGIVIGILGFFYGTQPIVIGLSLVELLYSGSDLGLGWYFNRDVEAFDKYVDNLINNKGDNEICFLYSVALITYYSDGPKRKEIFELI